MVPDEASDQSATWQIVIVSLVSLIVVGPIWIVLRPSPVHYFDFIKKSWDVRLQGNVKRRQGWYAHLQGNDERPRWLPHFFSAVFLDGFVSQADSCFLNYPLLYTKLHASVGTIGVMDAVTKVATFVCIVPFLKWRRSHVFVANAVLKALGYIVILGVALRWTRTYWLGLALALIGQVAAATPLSNIEYGVMRNDALADIAADHDDDARTMKAQSVLICQLQTVIRYPASLAASIIVPQFLGLHVYEVAGDGICNAYAVVGVISTASSLWLAWCWRGLSKVRKKHLGGAPKKSNALQDVLCGGRHGKIFIRLAYYTAALSITRNGYVRMLNLRALELGDVKTDQKGFLIGVMYLASTLFFWLSDIAVNTRTPLLLPFKGWVHYTKQARLGALHEAGSYKERVQFVKDASDKTLAGIGLISGVIAWFLEIWRENMRGKVLAGIVGFGLMAGGHASLGLATGYTGFLASALLFGFGEAVTTGLGTAWKDELREYVRQKGEDAAYEKAIIQYLGAVSDWAAVVNSLVLGLVGHFSMRVASLMYAVLGAWGLVFTLRMRHSGMRVEDSSDTDYKRLADHAKRPEPGLAHNIFRIAALVHESRDHSHCDWSDST